MQHPKRYHPPSTVCAMSVRSRISLNQQKNQENSRNDSLQVFSNSEPPRRINTANSATRPRRNEEQQFKQNNYI